MAGREPQIELVCFDLGDVLIRICRGWPHAFESAGLTPPAEEMTDAQRAEMNEAVALSEVDAIDPPEFARRVSRLFGVAEADLLAAADAYLLGPYDGVVELIDDLCAAGVHTACLSNTNAGHWRLMTEAGGRCYLPLDRMTYRFASHLSRARKPDPPIYEHVERESGLRGGSILFFDNLAENVEAARRRGWRGEVILPNEPPVAQMRRWLTRYDVLPPEAAPPRATEAKRRD